MKRKLPTHSERIRIRQKINGRPYPDNPLGLPSNNDGELITLTKRHNQYWQFWQF